MNANDLLLDTYKCETEYYSHLQKYEEANVALVNYIELKDQLERELSKNMIENAQAIMQSEIALAQNQLQKEQIEKQFQVLRTQWIVIIAILVTMVVALGFLYQYWKRVKEEKINSERQSKLNEIIIKKSNEIQKINESLDQEVKNKTADLNNTNKILVEKKEELIENLHQKDTLTQQLISSNKMLAESQKITKLGSWGYDVITKKVTFTEETYRQLGLVPKLKKPKLELLQERMSVADFKKIDNAIEKIKKKKVAQTVQVEINDSSGNTRNILIKMIPEFENSELVRIYGSNQDITATVSADQLERKIMNTLLDLSKKTALTENTFEQFIEELLKKSARLLDVKRVSYWNFHSRDESLECFKAYLMDSKSFTHGTILYAKDLPNYFKALYNNRTIAANNAYIDKRTTEFSTDYLPENDIYSLLDAQVQLEGKLIGVLCFEQTMFKRKWSYSDQRLVGSLADIISTAYSTFRNLNLTKEKQRLISKLYRQNENLEEFAYVTSHNLRGPSAQILGLLHLLEKEDNNESIQSIIDHLQKSGDQLDHIINDLGILLSIQEVEREEMEYVSLDETISEVKEMLKQELEEVAPELVLNYHEELGLLTHRVYLTNIIYQLFSNSLKFRKQSQPIQIKLTVYQLSDRIIFELEDNGQGIDLDRFGDKLFKMYQRFHLEVEGKGLGLYMVKSQVELLGGKINIESKPNSGTKIRIILPHLIHEAEYIHRT